MNRQSCIDEQTLLKSTQLFKALSDPSRLQLIHALMQNPRSVGELVTCTQQEQSAVSHHLAKLLELNLVSFKQQGKQRIYRISDRHVSLLVRNALTHARE